MDRSISIFSFLILLLMLSVTPVNQATASPTGILTRVTTSTSNEVTPSLCQANNGTYLLTFTIDERPYGVEDIFFTVSQDGLTWELPMQITNLGDAVDPYLLQDRSGRYWLSFGRRNSKRYDIALTYSDNLIDWSTPKLVVTGSEHQFDPSMIQDAQGTYWMAYNTYDGIYLMHSVDGNIWSSAQHIVSEYMACSPSLIQDDVSEYWVAYNRKESGTYIHYNYLVHSSDGINWSSPQRPFSDQARVCSMIQDDESTYWITYDVRENGNPPFDIFISSSPDGSSWKEPEPLDANSTDEESWPSMIQDSAGVYWIAFHSDRNGDMDIYVWRSNRPPTADAGPYQTVSVGSDCTAAVTLDGNGSYDPDEDPLTYEWSWDSDTVSGVNPTITLPLGTHTITLTVSDEYEESTDTVGIQVVDKTPPIIQSNAPDTIKPPDVPISFTATATDDCEVSSVIITNYDCYFINGAGKEVDKTESCVVSINGDTITIEDSGGVGDIITWTVTANDSNGNIVSEIFEVKVVNPGKGKDKK